MAGVQIDGVNNKIDFDDDLDTSISANTDDTLVIEAGGNTMATITATTFTINDGTTITTADNTAQLTLKSTDADANVGPDFVLQRDSGSPADDDSLGRIRFVADNDAGEALDHISINASIRDASDGTEDAQLTFNMLTAGAVVDAFHISPTETVFNDASADRNFRIESNDNAVMFVVDGENNRIGIGTNAPADALHIKAGNGIIRLMEATQADTKYAELESSNGRLFLHSDRGNAESGSDMRFNVDNTERMRIHSNGNVSIPGGVELGSGLDATAANLLDDYEEGTWAPAWHSGANGRSISGTGGYTKVGNLVTVFGKFEIGGSNNTGSGDVQFSGLPFTSTNISAQRSAISIFLTRCASAVDGYVSGFVNDNSQVFFVREGGIVADGNDLGNHFDQDTEFWLSISYRTA